MLKPDGALHVTDWRRPARVLMRLAFQGVRFPGGFETTADLVRCHLPPLFAEAGFEPVLKRAICSTLSGTIALFSARKPASFPLIPAQATGTMIPCLTS